MKLTTPLTLGEVAKWLNLHYKGDPNVVISGINEIHKVEPGDLTFVDHPKYYDRVLSSPATTIVIDQDQDPPEGKALLVAEDPFSVFNQLAGYYRLKDNAPEQPVYHRGQEVVLGQGVQIFPGVYLGDQVHIGDYSVIYPNTVIYAGTQIGSHVTIHANTTIGADAFYFKSRGTYHEKMLSSGKVVIEDHVEIGSNCSIDRGVSGYTHIGEGTKIDGEVHLGHGVVIGKHCLIAAQVGIGGKTILEDYVKLWGQVGLNKSIRLGKGAEILASSAVSKSIPGNETYFGIPALPTNQAYRELAAVRKLPRWQQEIENRLTAGDNTPSW
jgi:UDP-3-O-[3-hydroxymyristoyl] glucosamine N-acyltransferase